MNQNPDDGIPDVEEHGRPLPEIEDAAELIAADHPLPTMLVEGLLHRGTKLVIGGSSKAKKTYTLLDLAISVAAGADWWGRKTHRGRVLYVNFEIPKEFFAKRISKILEARGLALEQGDLAVWNLRGFAGDIEELLPKIIAKLNGRDFVLIIVDPIYKCFGRRDENKAGDIAIVMNQLERIAVEIGAAVAFGAHFSKGNQSEKASIDRISGSGVFARDPDSILTMTQHREADAFAVEATLRNLPPIKPFCVRWEHPLMTKDDNLRPEDLKSKGGGKRIPTDQEFVNLLPPFGIGSKPQECLMTNEEVKEQLRLHGYYKDAVAAIRDGAKKRGLIGVIRQDRGKLLIGVPEAVEAFLAEGAGNSNGATKRKPKGAEQ